MMLRYILTILTILTFAASGLAQEHTKGLYFASGGSWSGMGTNGDFGYFTSAGMWIKLGNGIYLVTPGQSEIQNSKRSSLALNPFVVIEAGNFLISGGPGITGYMQNDLALSYAQVEMSLTWLFKNPKWYDTDLSGMPTVTTGTPMKSGLTLLARYLPGNKYKTLVLTLTILN